MKWTDEQYDAIMKDNTSIIVSAGAGSGKTAVLTERVIRKIKDGININELLILTFTNKAAAEMRERIRKSLKKHPDYINQLNLLNEAYITTFDSFALSIIKKYHNVLNLSKDISIADSSLIYLEKIKIVEHIFENLYEENNTKFIKLITDFCIKDDNDIKKYILNIYDSTNLLIDKKNYFDYYFDNVFCENSINNCIREYENIIREKIDELYILVEQLKNEDDEYYYKVYNTLEKLFESNCYDNYVENINIRLPNIPKDSGEELKFIKECISDNLKAIKDMMDYSSTEEIKETIYLTQDYIDIIISIIKEIDDKLFEYKKSNNIYEFNDISMMLINLLKNNPKICLELKEQYNEIMIDEYQDTSDIQEAFIKLISNNNVYMVGDIKQSIYRFRNANPDIFKNKYLDYSKNINGYKIDLNKNFRSRNEVLDNINLIFSELMSTDIGGADYNSGHAMIYGNKSYDELIANSNYHMDIFNYSYDKSLGFTKEEIEIFTIADDIIKKVENKYQVVDKKTFNLRDCTYQDFVILVDRSTNFELFKKIFEYKKIPLTIYKDEKLNNEIEITVIKNIIKFILKIKENIVDNEFKYLFTSVARSFIFEYDDNKIFEIFVNNTFTNNEIYNKCCKLTPLIDYANNSLLLETIYDEFNIFENIIKLGSIQNRIVRLDYLTNLTSNLDNLGFSINDFSEYLNDLITNEYDIRFSLSKESPNSVQIMTIHTSKGLEFNICYFPLLYKEFNLRDLTDKFLFDNQYGIITPYFKEGIGKTIYKYLLKNKYLKEEISEKIRLFYVALTRAKEKMIFITESNDEKNVMNKFKFRSFLDMLIYIKDILNPYISNINLTSLNLSQDYKLVNKTNDLNILFTGEEKINAKTLIIENIEQKSSKFSKNNYHFISKEEEKKLEIGTYFHYLLEILDFKNLDINKYNIDDFYKNAILNFLKNDIFDDIKNCNIYKEYEFIDIENNDKKHGIIDLLIEHDNFIDIVDYKFKNIDDENYNNQLSGYKNYIEKKFQKKVNIYLYSIIKNELKKIEI